MTTIEQDIRDAHALVWDVRGRIGHLWLTPPPEDALLFALTELGEAADAYLRSKPEYNRNNARQPDLDAELADVALMLLTALPGEWYDTNPQVSNTTLTQTLASVAWALWFALNTQERPDRWRAAAETQLHHIAQHLDTTLTDAVRRRLERIEQRVMADT